MKRSLLLFFLFPWFVGTLFAGSYKLTPATTNEDPAAIRIWLGIPTNGIGDFKADGSVGMTGSFNLGGQAATNGATPTRSDMLANKGYVDSAISGATNDLAASVNSSITNSTNNLDASALNRGTVADARLSPDVVLTNTGVLRGATDGTHTSSNAVLNVASSGYASTVISGNTLTITGTQSGESNVVASADTGSGYTLVAIPSKSGVTNLLRSLTFTGYSSVATNGSNITVTILQSGETNTATSLGSGTSLVAGKSGTTNQFNSVAVTAPLTLGSNANTITFGTSPAVVTTNGGYIAGIQVGGTVLSNAVVPFTNTDGNVSITTSGGKVVVNVPGGGGGGGSIPTDATFNTMQATNGFWCQAVTFTNTGSGYYRVVSWPTNIAGIGGIGGTYPWPTVSGLLLVRSSDGDAAYFSYNASGVALMQLTMLSSTGTNIVAVDASAQFISAGASELNPCITLQLTSESNVWTAYALTPNAGLLTVVTNAADLGAESDIIHEWNPQTYPVGSTADASFKTMTATGAVTAHTASIDTGGLNIAGTITDTSGGAGLNLVSDSYLDLAANGSVQEVQIGNGHIFLTNTDGGIIINQTDPRIVIAATANEDSFGYVQIIGGSDGAGVSNVVETVGWDGGANAWAIDIPGAPGGGGYIHFDTDNAWEVRSELYVGNDPISGTLIQGTQIYCPGFISCADPSATNQVVTVHYLTNNFTTNLPPVAVFYTGSTNIGTLATSLTISIGHTMPSTNYVPSVSFIGAAGALPYFSGLTKTNFVMNLAAGITGGDNLVWSTIFNP